MRARARGAAAAAVAARAAAAGAVARRRSAQPSPSPRPRLPSPGLRRRPRPSRGQQQRESRRRTTAPRATLTRATDGLCCRTTFTPRSVFLLHSLAPSLALQWLPWSSERSAQPRHLNSTTADQWLSPYTLAPTSSRPTPRTCAVRRGSLGAAAGVPLPPQRPPAHCPPLWATSRAAKMLRAPPGQQLPPWPLGPAPAQPPPLLPPPPLAQWPRRSPAAPQRARAHTRARCCCWAPRGTRRHPLQPRVREACLAAFGAAKRAPPHARAQARCRARGTLRAAPRAGRRAAATGR